MTASPDENTTRPLSQDEIARLDALKSDGVPVAILIVVMTLVMVLLTWERYGAFWTAMELLAGLAMAALTVLGRSGANANLQADMDGGLKRLAAATVVKVSHDGEQSRYRIQLRTEETPPCMLEFTPPDRVFFEVEYGEQVRIAYAPASKTVISVVAVGCEYELVAQDAASQAAPEYDGSADARLRLRRAQRDAARKLRRMAPSTRADLDLQDDLGQLRPEATASIDDTPQAAKPRVTGPLNGHDRDRLAARRMSGCGIVAFLCALGLVLAAVCMVASVNGIDEGATAAMVVAVLLAATVVAFVVSNEDDKLQSDLDMGVKVSVSGRISQMRTESSEGGGSPYCFITVAVDGPPPRTIVFLVESRLFHALLPEDAVRIVYVPASKTLLHLRTDSYSYSLRLEDETRAT
ncbi:hypothetical protein GLA29479_851 [Lysobacter antibioticus]|uniref:hypothetical protein n=1 Tax=Lysobacter antibioticus TaxID=84531 RepID=UPI0007173BEC|nr:hypothetical protein [Lysobacter antibioticus]ALN61735.1 hypothetical protein GLA29479_851 [Lysobacter antibioticus]